MFNPDMLLWTDCSTTMTGNLPSPRVWHGFSSAGSKLYVHGGLGLSRDQFDYVREFLTLSSFESKCHKLEVAT